MAPPVLLTTLLLVLACICHRADAVATFDTEIEYPTASGNRYLPTTCTLTKLNDTLYPVLTCNPLPAGVPAGTISTLQPCGITTSFVYKPSAAPAPAPGYDGGFDAPRSAPSGSGAPNLPAQNSRKLLQTLTTATSGQSCPVGYIYIPPGLDVYLLGLNLNISSSVNISLTAYANGGVLGTLLCALSGASSPAPASPLAPVTNAVAPVTSAATNAVAPVLSAAAPTVSNVASSTNTAQIAAITNQILASPDYNASVVPSSNSSAPMMGPIMGPMMGPAPAPGPSSANGPAPSNLAVPASAPSTSTSTMTSTSTTSSTPASTATSTTATTPAATVAMASTSTPAAAATPAPTTATASTPAATPMST